MTVFGVCLKYFKTNLCFRHYEKRRGHTTILPSDFTYKLAEPEGEQKYEHEFRLFEFNTTIDVYYVITVSQK